jgi:hypothetical protein
MWRYKWKFLSRCIRDWEHFVLFSRTRLERRTKEGDSPVSRKTMQFPNFFLSTTRHEKSGRKSGRLRSKAKYSYWPIVNKYREGKVKSTPEGEWNSFWNRILTRSGRPYLKIYFGMVNRVPIEEWSNELILCGLLKSYQRRKCSESEDE